MVTISACFIVRNEEEVLERGLESLKGIYDELIIVDTGSTDRTKEIAKKYTDKVYDFTWIDDFSAARNYSFSKATMEYIYVGDADEVLEPEEHDKFIKLKQALLPEIEIVQMHYSNQLEHNTTYNFDMELRPKLYKRLRSFVWKDPVHESVVLEPIIYDSDVIISHRPTSNHGKRDFKIFQKAIHKDGGLSEKLEMMYARELYIAGDDNDFIEAYPYFKMQIEERTDTNQLKPVYPVLLHCARIKKDEVAMLTYSVKVLAAEMICSEACFELAEFYYERKMYKEATPWFYNAAFECYSELDIRYQREFPLRRLAECYRCLGDEETYKHYMELAKESVKNSGL